MTREEISAVVLVVRMSELSLTTLQRLNQHLGAPVATFEPLDERSLSELEPEAAARVLNEHLKKLLAVRDQLHGTLSTFVACSLAASDDDVPCIAVGGEA